MNHDCITCPHAQECAAAGACAMQDIPEARSAHEQAIRDEHHARALGDLFALGMNGPT